MSFNFKQQSIPPPNRGAGGGGGRIRIQNFTVYGFFVANQQVLTPRDFNPGFSWTAIKVDNFTQGWLHLVEPDVWVPPQTLGFFNQIDGTFSALNIVIATPFVADGSGNLGGNYTVAAAITFYEHSDLKDWEGKQAPLLVAASQAVSPGPGLQIPILTPTGPVNLTVDEGLQTTTLLLQNPTSGDFDAWEETGNDAVSSQGIAMAGIMVFNGVTFDMLRGTGGAINVAFSGTAQDNTDAQAVVATGLSKTVDRLYIFNGTTWDRVRGTPSTDGQVAAGLLQDVQMLYNGATYDRRRSMPAVDNNPVVGLASTGIELWNSANYDRLAGVTSSDSVGKTGIIGTAGLVFNNSGWDRIRGGLPGDGNVVTGLQHPAPMLYNGVTFDRQRSGGVTGMAGVSGDTASNVADAGNPVKIGSFAQDITISGYPAAVGANSRRSNQISDKYGIVYHRPPEPITYTALYRLGARPYPLSHAFAAAGRFQYATLHHTAGATKLVKIIFVSFSANQVITNSAQVYHDLLFITTAPATGNPAITPTPHRRADAASEAVALALPTTQATEGALITARGSAPGVTAVAPTTNPLPEWTEQVIFDARTRSASKPILLAPATLEGVTVTIDSGGIITYNDLYIRIEFTEE